MFGLENVDTTRTHGHLTSLEVISREMTKETSNIDYLHMKAISQMAAKCRQVIITKARIKSRCDSWWTTVNLVRC